MKDPEQYNLLDRLELEKKRGHGRRDDTTPRCSHCGAKMVEYRHTMTKGLASALIRLYRHGSPARLRDLHFDLAKATNFQKLRYFGLIEQVELDETRTGKWRITQLGEQWVRATCRIRKHVWTYRGQVRREDGDAILITDVLDDYSWRVHWAQEAEAVSGAVH